ncbi:hypothetical protein ACFRAQ_34740 [Nocardia sp. NPDC056611]|uniref:hypothetical protein n=1 Tax=Nocardia sp. NPDC056611 TaxID=3345877 RepID=UPI00366A570F
MSYDMTPKITPLPLHYKLPLAVILMAVMFGATGCTSSTTWQRNCTVTDKHEERSGNWIGTTCGAYSVNNNRATFNAIQVNRRYDFQIRGKRPNSAAHPNILQYKAR